MRLLFVTSHPHAPQIAGGSQSSTHELAEMLIARGHEVSVLAGIYHRDLLGYRTRLILKLSRRKYVCDRLAGYPTYRKWFVWEDAQAILDECRPDVVAVTAGQPFRTARAFAEHSVPMVVYLRDVEFDRLGGRPGDLPEAVVYLANSEFTANRYREVFGIDPIVVPPLFVAEKYAARPRPENVTFINPHPKKGRDTAFDIAERCPDIPFVFVEGWPLDKEQTAINRQRLARAANVTLKPRARDVRPIYARARVLLVPSRWEEAWGRVASEAHFSGVPVVATRHGGLPESVGEGGILIDPQAGADAWAEAVLRLWRDDDCHARMSAAALAYAQRPALNPDRQLDLILAAFEKARASGAVPARLARL